MVVSVNLCTDTGILFQISTWFDGCIHHNTAGRSYKVRDYSAAMLISLSQDRSISYNLKCIDEVCICSLFIYICSNCFIKVVHWFYMNAAIYGLLCEPIVRNALLDDQRQTPEFPFRRFFPSYIDKSSIPKPTPKDSDEPVGPIFQKNGINHTKLYEVVEAGIKLVMTLTPEERTLFRYHKFMYYRFIVTTAVPWQRLSQARHRDWWAITAGAFLESLAVQGYHPKLLATAFGWARKFLEEIIFECIKGRYVDIPGTLDRELVKRWEWADMMSVPPDLPSLEEFLKADPEAEFRKLVAILKVRRDVQSFLNMLFRLDCARDYRDEFIDLKSVKKVKSAGGEKVDFKGPVIKRRPYAESKVYHQAHSIAKVCRVHHFYSMYAL